GRVDAWYTALQLFIWRPITGVGMGLFTEHNKLTAHNSWMLVLAELGLFGYMVWFSLAGFSTQQMYVVGKYVAPAAARPAAREAKPASEPRVQSLGLTLFYTSVGVLVCAFFLSRSYSLLFFLYWGLCAGMYNGARARLPGMAAVGSHEFGKHWAIAAVASIPAFYVLIRVLLVVNHD